MYKILVFIVIIVLLSVIIFTANKTQDKSDIPEIFDVSKLPPIETFIIEPITIARVDMWVPAAKTGLLINRSCQPKLGNLFSSILPASVEHTKTDSCPDELARLLAEHISSYHEKSLPLTIFNGWQWEYSYSLSQFEEVSYDLSQRGGSWENCWEAILSGSTGYTNTEWIRFPNIDDTRIQLHSDMPQTKINVHTFNYMRTRDGYPKIRQLD